MRPPDRATGTLTLNKLTIKVKELLVIEEGMTPHDVYKYAALSSDKVGQEPIDVVLITTYEKVGRRSKLPPCMGH